MEDNELEFDDLIDFDEFDDVTSPEADEVDNTKDADFAAPTEETEEVEEVEKPNEAEESEYDLTGQYDLLKGYGALDVPEDFEFDGSEEKFEKALQVSEARKQAKLAEDLWKKLPDDFKPLLAYGLNGGTDLNSYLNAHSGIDIKEDDLEDVTLQRKVVEEYYLKTSNHPQERIDRMISKLEERGDLYEESIDALNELKQLKEAEKANLVEKAKQEQAVQQQKALEEAKKIEQTIDKVDFVDETRKNRIKSFILAPIKVDNRVTTQFDNALEQVFNNEEHFIQLADLLADYNPKQGFNLERIKKKLKTENNKAFKRLLDETLSSTRKGPAKKPLNEDFN
jgi:hypothetical protein